jgi:endonuclease-8
MITDVLLDQRIVAGIGNIYKCEALFTAGIDPRALIEQLDAGVLEGIYAAAHRFLIANVRASPGDLRSRSGRTERQGGTEAFLVYSRTSKPCTRCGTPIACESLGEPARWTWWCPTCQPPRRH